MMFQSMIKSTTKKRNPQFFNQQYFKSIDAAANNEEMLPSIHASSNVKRFPVKSPVMESIRASRNLGAKNFMSAQRVDSPSKYSSDDDVSQVSKVSNMRKSYIRARKNKLNTSTLNKGTFFVHKREKSAKPAEKHQSVIRASTFLNNSVIFSSINKNPKKKEPEARKSKNVFSDRRTSKSFVEKVGFNNHLAVNNLQQSYIMNPCIESKEGSEDFGDFGDVMEHDITTSQNFSGRQKRGVSLKSDGKAYSKQNTDENKRRCTTKAGTNDGGPGERGVLTTSPEDHLSDNYCISPDDSNS